MKLTNKITTLMLLLALLLSPTTMVIGQDEEPEEKPTAEKPAEEKPAEEEKPKTQPNRPTGSPTYVGRGYDITERFADARSVRRPIFDLSEEDVTMEPINYTKSDSISGKSLSEYQSNFSNKLSIGGSYKIFSASVSVNFEKNEGSSTAKDYVTMSRLVVRRSYEMPYDATDKINPAAREAIDSADTEALFEQYGTHYVWLAEVGGRVDYNMTFNKAATQREVNLQVSAKLALNAVIGSANIENETAYKNSLKKIEEAGSVKIETFGGSPETSARIDGGQTGLGEWSKSVDENPVLCNLNARSLKPIWKLASTPERQKEIEAAFLAYASKKEIKEAPGMIAVKKATGVDQVASNWYGAGTGGAGNVHHQFAAWTPKADTANGYYVVGHAANRDSETKRVGTIKTILVKEIGEPGKLLAPPINFTKVTEYSGKKPADQWSVWRANCPVNFVPLGDFARWGHDEPNMDIPSQNPFKDVRCVNFGQVEAAAKLSKNEVIHDNDGSGEWKVITYKIKPAAGSGGIDGNFFYTVRVEDFNEPPPTDVDVYVLKNQAVAGLSVITRESNESLAGIFPTVRGAKSRLFR